MVRCFVAAVLLRASIFAFTLGTGWMILGNTHIPPAKITNMLLICLALALFAIAARIGVR